MTISSLAPRRRGVVGAAVTAAACLAGVIPSPATPAAADATGRICGVSRCVTLPRALAIELSQRNGTFQTVATPRPTAFYRVTIEAAGHGLISKTIIWAFAARAWYVQEYSKWPEVGYWRGEAQATRAALTRITRNVRPFPSPRKWVLPR